MSVSYSAGARHALQAKRKRLLKIIGMALSGLMVVGMLTILALIVRSERAHDEQTCKFVPVVERSLGQTRVIEQNRTCVSEVEERRYLVSRPGQETFELARKRMSKPAFTHGNYTWSLREDDKHRLVVRIDVNGKLVSEFFEEDVRP